MAHSGWPVLCLVNTFSQDEEDVCSFDRQLLSAARIVRTGANFGSCCCGWTFASLLSNFCRLYFLKKIRLSRFLEVLFCCQQSRICMESPQHCFTTRRKAFFRRSIPSSHRYQTLFRHGKWEHSLLFHASVTVDWPRHQVPFTV